MSGNTSPLLRFFDELFDIIFNSPFLTFKKYCAVVCIAELVYELFGRTTCTASTLDFCPDQIGRNQMYPNYRVAKSFSMTTLLTHTVAHSARHSFRSKTNNHLIKNSRSLEFTWTKILKLSCTFSPSFTVLSFCFEFDSHTLSTLVSSSI